MITNHRAGCALSPALAVWAAIFLVGAAAIDGLAMLSTTATLPIIDSARFGAVIPPAQAAHHDDRQRFVAWAQLISTILAFILFLAWVYCTTREARALGVEGMKYTPAWSVGWFFVPIAVLWKPCFVMREMWRASSPEHRENWRRAAVSALVGTWWAAALRGALLPALLP